MNNYRVCVIALNGHVGFVLCLLQATNLNISIKKNVLIAFYGSIHFERMQIGLIKVGNIKTIPTLSKIAVSEVHIRTSCI